MSAVLDVLNAQRTEIATLKQIIEDYRVETDKLRQELRDATKLLIEYRDKYDQLYLKTLS